MKTRFARLWAWLQAPYRRYLAHKHRPVTRMARINVLQRHIDAGQAWRRPSPESFDLSRCANCPVAYALIETTGDPRLRVGYGWVSIWFDKWGEKRRTMGLLPWVAQDFIQKADAGEEALEPFSFDIELTYPMSDPISRMRWVENA